MQRRKKEKDGGMSELLQMYQMFSPEQQAREQLLQQQLAAQQQEMNIKSQMTPLQIKALQLQYDGQAQQQAQQMELNPLMLQKLQQELAFNQQQQEQQGAMNPLVIQRLQAELENQAAVDPLKMQMLQQEIANQKLQGQGVQSNMDYAQKLQPLQLEQQKLQNQYYPKQMDAEIAMQQLQKDAYLMSKQAQMTGMASEILPMLPTSAAVDLPSLMQQKQQVENATAFLPPELATRIRGMYPTTQLPPEQLQPFVESMQAGSQTPFVAGQQVSQALEQNPALKGSLTPFQQTYLKGYQAVAEQPNFDPSQLPQLGPKSMESLLDWQKKTPEQRQADASPGMMSWLMGLLNPAAATHTLIRQAATNGRATEFAQPLPPNFFNR